MTEQTISKDPRYNLSYVIQETGIKADRLRAWERRYQLPQPQRTEGGHRLFSEYDIQTIKWLMARQNLHFGASGLTHGMFFFLLVGGLMRRDLQSMALLMIAFFMYGTMVLTIFPRDPQISFESHFFGAMGGVLAALLFRSYDPQPLKKVYSWDFESEEEEDPVIGDLWKKRLNEKDDNQPP